MRIVKRVVAVDDALDAYRNALTNLLVDLDESIRHHNTDTDAARREVWREMREGIVGLRDAAYFQTVDETIASLVRMAAQVAR
jgi:hypothetical protein